MKCYLFRLSISLNTATSRLSDMLLTLRFGVSQWRVRVAQWLSHLAVVQEVSGSNPVGAESVGE